MMDASILYKKLTILTVHACLEIWLEPVVSRPYHFPGRQHDAKSVQFIFCYSKNKVFMYTLIITIKLTRRLMYKNYCMIQFIHYQRKL